MKLLFVPLRFLITPVFIAAVDVVLLFPMVLSLIDVGQGIPRHVDTHEPVTITSTVALMMIGWGGARGTGDDPPGVRRKGACGRGLAGPHR